MHKIFIMLFMLSSLSFAQSYFPLEIGNRWDYIRTDIENNADTFSVNVIGDTIMPNGQMYYVLDEEMGPSRFLHVDSNYIYYYDQTDSTDEAVYNLNAKLGESYAVGIYSVKSDSPRVELMSIDTTIVFGETTRVLSFHFDWLTPFSISLSDKFGPIGLYTAHHEPYWTNILGCTISGTIYGNLVSVEGKNEIFNNFHLSQNYPNPFNPTTKISFTIPQKSKVLLSVFSVSGEKIVDLVNDNLNSGSYEYEFNGSNLSSGIYFYQLRTDKFIEIKKLILLK